MAHEELFRELGIDVRTPHLEFELEFGIPADPFTQPAASRSRSFLEGGFLPVQDLGLFVFRQEVFADPAVLPTVLERPGGGVVGTAPPLEQPQVSILGDIVGGVRDIFTSDRSGGILGQATDFLGGVLRRQVTTAEERVLSGDFTPSDLATAIGNVGAGILTEGNILDRAIFGGGTSLVPFQQPGGLSVANGLIGGSIGVAPCPTPGSSAGFPAGQCITINDWAAIGGPRGFEAVGVSQGGTVILKKKRRRRRRSGLTKGMISDLTLLKDILGAPSAKTYLNRVL